MSNLDKRTEEIADTILDEYERTRGWPEAGYTERAMVVAIARRIAVLEAAVSALVTLVAERVK